MTELTPTDVAAWMRRQAQTYLDMASQLEANFGLKVPVVPERSATHVSANGSSVLTVSSLKQVMGTRKWRLKDLCRRGGWTPRQISHFLVPENGFRDYGQGWLGVDPAAEKEQTP